MYFNIVNAEVGWRLMDFRQQKKMSAKKNFCRSKKIKQRRKNYRFYARSRGKKLRKCFDFQDFAIDGWCISWGNLAKVQWLKSTPCAIFFSFCHSIQLSLKVFCLKLRLFVIFWSLYSVQSNGATMFCFS